MQILISAQFESDISSLKSENKNLPNKVWELIFDILHNSDNPLKGLGRPEALKNNLKGYYSRRITQKHRLIYTIKEGVLHLVSCFGHYDDK